MNGFSDEYTYDSVTLKNKEKKGIRFLSVMAMLCVVGYIVMSEAVSYIIGFSPLTRLIRTSQTAYECFSLLVTVISLFPPFLLAGYIEKKKTGIDICPLGRPVSPRLMALAVPAGVSVCIIGSILTSFIVSLFSFSGVTLSQPSLASPSSGYALFIYLLRLTVVPALMEEVCFRGVIMQPLRKYGNFFAIVMSAMIFALTHCNLIQAPAAFVSGLAIAYFTIATGTVWTGVLIHLVNNMIVAAAQYLLAAGLEDAAIFVDTTVAYILLFAGFLCLLLFFALRKTAALDIGMRTSLKAREKAAAYIFNPAMIAVFIAVAFIMRGYISI